MSTETPTPDPPPAGPRFWERPEATDPDRPLDATDFALLAALVRGESTTRAAASAGVSVSTAYRRSRNAAFIQQLAEGLASRYEPVANAAVRLVPTALKRLKKVLRDPAAKASDHVAAARAVFDAAHRFTDTAASLRLRELMADPTGDR